MNRTHPLTGAILVRGTRPFMLRFGSQTTVVDMPGWYAVCDLEGDYGLHDPEDMQVSDHALAKLRRAGEAIKDDDQGEIL